MTNRLLEQKATCLAAALALSLPALAVTTTGYEDFGDTAGVILWRGTEANFHESTVIDVASDGSLGQPYAMKADQTATSWQRFASNQSAYASPGVVLVYDSAGTGDGYKYNPDCSFSPLSFGGMWVKTLAINGLPFSILGSGTRNTEFGASGKSTLFKFDASYTINRTGTTTFLGEATVDIAQGATFTAQANSSHVVAVDSAAMLKLNGAGTLAVTTMNVAGTLDLSASTRPAISGNVSLASNATLVVPAGTVLDGTTSLAVCSGTLSAAGVVYVKVGNADPVAAELTISGGTITQITTGIQTEQTFTSNYPDVVPAGYTYTYVGGATADAAVTIPSVTVNGTLKTKGYFTITTFASGAGSLLEVVDGSTSVGNSTACQVKGSLTVDAGATLVNRDTDLVDYNTTSVPRAINIYGTLAMGNTRWSIRDDANCKFNLYPGALVTGGGDALGTIDIFQNSSKINVYGGESGGTATIEGPVRSRTDDTPIWVAADTTLILAGGFKNAGTPTTPGGFRATGPGTIRVDALSNVIGNFSITDGKVQLNNLSDAVYFDVMGGTLEVVATASSATMPVNAKLSGGTITSSGEGKVNGTITSDTAANAGNASAFLQSAAWTGTFVANWAGARSTRFDVNSYGNANSVVEVTELADGYVSSGSVNNFVVVPTVNVSGSMYLSNGFSGKITTFSKMTGSGSFSNAGYTCDITTLDGFTGTLTPTDSRGMQIGTINLSAAPTAGAKIVNLGEGANIYSIDTTKITVNGELAPFVATLGEDGIYATPAVAYVVFQQEVGGSFEDVTNYYTTVSAAITAATALKKTVCLAGAPDQGDTYSITAGETVRIKKNGFTYNGIVFPQGGEYNNTTTEAGGITLYSCTLNVATITYTNGTVEATSVALGQLLPSLWQTYTPASAGLVVTVFDGSDVGFVDPTGGLVAMLYDYNSTAHTYTLKPMIAAIAFEQGGIAMTQYVPDLTLVVQAATQYDVTVTLLEDLDLSSGGSLYIPATVGETALHSVTLDLGGKTVTGPSDGYVLVNAGNSVTIIGAGTVTGAGIVTNSAAGAVTVISNGTYTATGNLFAAEEGSDLTVYGGTFNQAVDSEYLPEGYEMKNNGDGTYGIREAKGWIYEMAGYNEHTGTWANEITYDAVTGKARIESDNTYTADSPSAGQMVTITATLSFDAINAEDDEISGAKAAVRLGAGANEGQFVFQLYTTNGVGGTAWVDVTASGVTATTNVDFTFTFVLDMTNRTYTAKVGEASLAADGKSTFAFAAANATDYVQSVEITGGGFFTSLIGSYEDAAAGFYEGQTIGSVTLTAAQAAWLNDQGNYAALSAGLATLTQNALNAAYLLNLNILSDQYDGTYTFDVTDIKFTKDEQENEFVVVTVELKRKGALAGGIKGTLKLKGGAALPTSTFDVINSVEFSDADFSDGDTTTCTFGKGDNPAEFYQPVIE